jgi:hypothetical protein
MIYARHKLMKTKELAYATKIHNPFGGLEELTSEPVSVTLKVYTISKGHVSVFCYDLNL